MTVWATRQPGHVRGLLSQQRALERAVPKLGHSARAEAVLRVLCRKADGAGFCWFAISTLIRESGYSRPSVFRALAELRDGVEPDLEVYSTRRDPSKGDPRLSRQARQGQGISIYRLGARLRTAAGLHEVDVV